MSERGRAYTVLTLDTLAFTVCFACWAMHGGLVVLTDKYGGRLVLAPLMLASAVPSGLRADAGGPVWQSR